MTYSTAQYRDSNGRARWAVYCAASRVWYFPNRYGRAAAERMAARLNREVQP